MGIVGSIVGVIFGVFLIGWLIAVGLILLAAKMAGVENATFGKAAIAGFVASLVTWLCSLVFSIVPVVGTILGAIFGLLLSIFVIKGVFSTTFGKAFLVWIFHVVAQVVAVIVAVLTFAGALFGFAAHATNAVIESTSPRIAADSPRAPQGDPAQDMQNARKLAAALEGYAVDNNRYPDASSIEAVRPLISPTYIREIPAGLTMRSNASGYEVFDASGKLLLRSGEK